MKPGDALPATDCWSCGAHYKPVPGAVAMAMQIEPGKTVQICTCSAIMLWDGDNFREPTDDERERLYQEYKHLPEAQQHMNEIVANGTIPTGHEGRAFYNDDEHGGVLDNEVKAELVGGDAALTRQQQIAAVISNQLDRLAAVYGTLQLLAIVHPPLEKVIEDLDAFGRRLGGMLDQIMDEEERLQRPAA